MYYNRYNISDIKFTCFTYNKKSYPAGTKFIYNGKCISNGEVTILNNEAVSFMYGYKSNQYFQNESNIYMCPDNEFINNIVKIGVESPKQEFYWTDSMVVKTIWYIIVMLFAIIFKERIGIWIFATIVWYCSVFKKK